jgi:tRNA pseudouridine38-40 synthase
MTAAADLIVGEHDFTSFAAVDPERVERMADGPKENDGTLPIENEDLSEETDVSSETATAELPAAAPTNIREIFFSAWQREGEELIYTIRGAGFLHHMVRNLVGTFVLLGKGTVGREEFTRVLASRQRSAAGPTAPASGLFLVSVEY